MKKTILLICILATISGLHAAEIKGVAIDKLYYTLDTTAKTAEVTEEPSGYEGEYKRFTGKLVIPSTVSYNSVTYKVTSIGEYAFYSCSGITELEIGENVKIIGVSAFKNCTGLTGTIRIPDSVTDILMSAFESCSNFNTLVLGKSIKNIGAPQEVTEYPPYLKGDNAGASFKGCDNLENLICLNSRAPYIFNIYWNNYYRNRVNNYIFSNFNKINFYVPSDFWSSGSITYNTAYVDIRITTFDEWSQFTNRFVLEESEFAGYLDGTYGEIRPSGISLNKNSLSMKVGDVETLIATLEPEGATGDVEWSVLPDGYVSVDNGKVTAFAVGQAVVTATCENFTATCVVTVTDNTVDNPTTPGVTPSDITATVLMEPDEDRDFSEMLPADVTASSWESSDEDVAEVNRRGRVDAWEFGRAYVTAKDASGNSVAVFEVLVCPTVSVQHGDGVIYSHHVVYNSYPTLSLNPGKGYKIAGVTHDGVDVTESLVAQDGKYVPAEPITANSVINLTLAEHTDGPTTGAGSVWSDSNIRIYVEGHRVRIVGASAGSNVVMTNLKGEILFNQPDYEIYVIDCGIYLVTVEGQTFKILVR